MQELIETIGTLPAKERKALAALLRQKGIDLFSVAPIFPRDPAEPPLLSYAQERQLFLWHLQPDSAAYHIPAALRLRGPLNVNALARSFSTLLARHETLRTTFMQDGEQAIQIIHPAHAVMLEPATLPIIANENAALLEARIQSWIETAVRQPFDLERGPTWRVQLLRLHEDEHILVLVQHHIASDAWSMQVIVEELVQLYACGNEGRAAELPPLPIQYADYALWQRAWMKAGEEERQLAYWSRQLGGAQPLLDLPTDRPRPQVQSYRGARLDMPLPGALSSALQQLAQRENVTLFMLLLASFQVLLHRYSGQRDIRVGVPIANRSRAETERLIGFFVNTQVFKADIDGQLRFSELLQQVKQTALDAQAHQDLPFERLVDVLQPARTLSHGPLFQVMYNHQREGRGDAVSVTRLGQLQIDNIPWTGRTAQFDLTLNTYESAHGLFASLTYATDLFEPVSAERIARHWQTLLQGIVADPCQRIGVLPVQGVAEQRQQIIEWNPAPAFYPGECCVHELIEVQATRTPDAIALSYGDEQLTYAQLNTRANQLAHRLIDAGIGSDKLVGIAVERSLEMVIGLLAILKAGGAYVPLDPEYPAERLVYMLQDSGVELLLTQSHLLPALPLAGAMRVLCLDRADSYSADSGNPLCRARPENLAYVIYTSGSTGKPKGTLLPHHNILRLFQATTAWFGFDGRDVWTLFHSYAFDFSVWELFGALLNGGRLVIVPRDITRSPEDFHALLRREQVTVLNQTPSAFKQLMRVATDGDAGKEASLALRYIVFGGEALDVNSLQPWFERYGDHAPRLINMYGITETTVHVSYRPLCQQDLHASVASPIGAVIADMSWYALDSELNPVGKGCRGELHVGRAGLARGYHNRPGLTAERFVPDPFDQRGGRLYRTGDLVHNRIDGAIDYLGRIDQQVKIRGFRIELGEIEAKLQQHQAVREAVVLALDGPNGKQLAAYVLPVDSAVSHGATDSQTILRSELKTYLAANLPDYMVPVHWTVLEKMPLTANGKLDRRALPEPDFSVAQATYAAPQTELEQQIAAIWQKVLGVDRIGLTDNFFELGGDSIVSIQVVSRARQAGIGFTPRDLFQHQTVQALAGVATRCVGVVIDQGPVVGAAPLTPIQKWFFQRDIPVRKQWNQSLLLTPCRALDVVHLQKALQRVLDHHDALRLRFTYQQGEWQAEFHSAEAAAILWTRQPQDLTELDAVTAEAQRSLNLEHGPLLRVVLVNLPEGRQRLLWVIHHLAVDGVSWRILLEDLQRAYTALAAGEPVRLSHKTSAYKHWAEHLQSHARSDALARELVYWKEQLGDSSDALPHDHASGGQERKHAATVTTRLDREWTRRLLQAAPSAYRTQINDLLLTALARVICRWTRRPSVLIRLEGHGREELFADIDLTRTVGWFTSMYPVRLSPQAALADSIKTIKEQLRAVPNKGIGYGLLRYLGTAETQRILQTLPQGSITFNYLGQFDQSFTAAQSLFTPAAESSGAGCAETAPLDNLISIDGQVYGGELKLSWTFSAEAFERHTLQQLADDYAQELQALISHCTDCATHGVTPSDFPLALTQVQLTQTQLDALPVPAQQIEDIYPLAPMQQGLLFHSLYEQRAENYINQMCVDVNGLDVPRFKAAWQSAVDAHEALRASFFSHLQQPLQVICASVAVPFVELDWRPQPDLDAALTRRARAERRRGFDLSQAPLLRLTVIRTGPDRHHVIYTSHHILLDGWSNSRLLAEVLQRYSGHIPAQTPGRYRDYIAWLQRQNQDQVGGELFWKAQLAPLIEPTRLVQAVRCDVDNAHGHGDYFQTLDVVQGRRLSEFARRQRVTVNTLVQAAWALLLQRYTGQACVAFGATVAGRPATLAHAEQQLGLFINTLPVIASARPEQTVADWIQQVQQQNLALREHEHTPLYTIQRWAGWSGEALFDTILVFENYPVSEVLQQGATEGLRFGNLRNHEQTHYPLTVLVEFSDSLSLHYSYARNGFSEAAIARLSEHLLHLLRQLVADAEGRIGTLSPLGAQEQQTILYDWNAARMAYPADRCIHSFIEMQTANTPAAPALMFGSRHLTYAQLNSRANSLAHRLIELGVGPEVLVGIAAERSAQMVIGLLAILKAGGAYVPLDPAYPRERVAYMLEHSGANLLLVQSSLQDTLPISTGIRTLCLDQCLDRPDIYGGGDSNPSARANAQNLAYVIYTSGSTGRPKGIAIAHRNVAALIHWSQQVYSPEDLQGVLAATSICFDLSVWELFVTLASGGYIVLARDALELPDLPARDRVRLINTVPSAIEALHRANAIPAGVRIINLAGEPLPQTLVDALYERPSLAHIYDLYGPSEDTTYSTYTRREQGGQVSIGRPLANTQSYVLSADLQPVPIGTAGELHLAGAGVSRGYLAQPALTAEKYIPNPFSCDGDRLYRSGDLTRYRPDGAIEYLGRIDHQVKIRGFRIELGEIETCLLQQVSVRAAVVLAQQGPKGPQLVGYIVPSATGVVQEAEAQLALRAALNDALNNNLPDYMVPAHLLFLDALPLTPNGKLDRTALPSLDINAAQQAYVPPNSPLERQIAAIWEEVLGVERVGATDNFFALGGHSLLATQVISRLSQVTQAAVSLRDLFTHPVIRDLAAAMAQPADTTAVAQSSSMRYVPLRAQGAKTVAPLSLMQRRLWVAEQLSGATAAYGMPLAIRLRGPLSVGRLLESFARLVQRHEVLRTAYVQDDEGDPLAVIAEQVEPGFTVEDIFALPSAKQEQRVAAAAMDNTRTPIALEHAPLFRGRILRLGPLEHVLLYSMHHIISDGWSMNVLVNDLVSIYGEIEEGFGETEQDSGDIEQGGRDAKASRNRLLPLPLQYSDFALWQQTPEYQSVLERQARHWKNTLAGYAGNVPLPTDYPRGTSMSYAGGSVSFQLSIALYQQLSAFSAETGVTLYTTLLASFQILLHRRARAADVVVGIDVAGRQHIDLEPLIGFFVNVLPIRSLLREAATAADFVRATGQTLLDALEHQDLPFDMIVDAAGAPRQPGMNPLVQTLFVMNNLPVRAAGLHEISVEAIPVPNTHSKFDMALFVHEEGGALHGFWQFATALFRREHIEQWVREWIDVLERIVADPAARLAEPGAIQQMPSDVGVNKVAPAADKLGKFLKRSTAFADKRPPAVVRESPLAAGQCFLRLEPVDASMDVVEWIKANRALVETKLVEHAGILFRGFALDGVAGFEAFAEAIQPGLYGNYGDLPKKEGGNKIYRSTPYPEQKMILFHNESSHQERWPRKQMFYCEQPAAAGGATPVVDCRLMYQKLPAALRATFERKGLLYVRTFTDKLDVPWQYFFHTESRGEVEARCAAAGIEWRWLGGDILQTRTRGPAIVRHPLTGALSFFNQVQLHHPYCLEAETREDLLSMFGAERMPRQVYYGDGAMIDDAVMQLIGELYEECAIRFDWNKGDVILLDNMLAAHARDPYREPRKIVVAMGDMIERSALGDSVCNDSAPPIPQEIEA